MKKVFALTFIFLFIFSAIAFAGNPKDKKIKKGNMIVGGWFTSHFAIGLELEEQQNNPDNLETNLVGFNLNGMFGYFVADGFELGPMLGVDYLKAIERDREVTDDQGDTTTVEIIHTNTLFDVGLQMGYFFETNTVTVPYIMVGVAYEGGTGSVNDEITDASMETTAIKVIPKVGVNFFFTTAIALDLAGYMDYTGGIRSYDFGDGSDPVDNDFLELDYGAAIGINVFF